jgi:hypothetical protein
VAQGVGSAEIALGAQDVFGGHLFAAIDYSGPKSYVPGGDFVDHRFFGFPNTMITLIGSLDQTQTFRLEPMPVRDAVTPWHLVWTVLATGQEVAGGTNLSGFTGRLTAIGY